MLTKRKPKSGIKSQPGKAPIDRVMDRTAIDETTGCWNYNGYTTPKGYGLFCLRQDGRKKQLLVHRLVWEHFNGPVPDGMFMLHKCDNPNCCNPDHLYPGTHAENMADACNRNRMKKGTDSNLSVLSEDEVIAIRRKYDDGAPIKRIAREFGVSRWAIYQIGRRQSWKHIPESTERPAHDFHQVALVGQVVNVADGVGCVPNLEAQQVIVASPPVFSPEVSHERPSQVVAALYRFA